MIRLTEEDYYRPHITPHCKYCGNAAKKEYSSDGFNSGYVYLCDCETINLVFESRVKESAAKKVLKECQQEVSKASLKVSNEYLKWQLEKEASKLGIRDYEITIGGES